MLKTVFIGVLYLNYWSVLANDKDWELWITSDLDLASRMSDFADVASVLGEIRNFQPSYYVDDGRIQNCYLSNSCIGRCTEGGWYCFYDAQQAISKANGRRVVLENLRQKCIWETTESESERHKVYWKYLSNFLDTCTFGNEPLSYDCSVEVQQKLNINTAVIETCSKLDENKKNEILDTELAKWQLLRPSLGDEPFDRVDFPILVTNNGQYAQKQVTPADIIDYFCKDDVVIENPKPWYCNCEKKGDDVHDCLVGAKVQQQRGNEGTSGVGIFFILFFVLLGLVVLYMFKRGLLGYCPWRKKRSWTSNSGTSNEEMNAMSIETA